MFAIRYHKRLDGFGRCVADEDVLPGFAMALAALR